MFINAASNAHLIVQHFPTCTSDYFFGTKAPEERIMAMNNVTGTDSH
jgi:hypothetical protein